MELTDCPSSPNCVSTEAFRKKRGVAPFALARTDAWLEIKSTILSLPRTKLAQEDDNFLHVECRSTLFRFIDDLEVQLRSAEGRLAVRSGARIGFYDFGVNRRRVERLREMLRSRGIIK